MLQVSCCFGLDAASLGELFRGTGTDGNNEGTKTTESEISETVPETSTLLEVPDMAIVSRVKVPGQAIDAKSLGGYAYLTNDLGVMFVIDVKDKENPKVVGKCTGINSANIVMIEGNYAYVSYTEWIFPESSDSTDDSDNGSGDSGSGINSEVYSICGFKIIDISDKRNPVVVGDYISGSTLEKSIQGLVIDGDFAYLNSTIYFESHSESSLEIIDIRDKSNPEPAGFCEIEGQPNGLDVMGDYAYLNNTYYDFNRKEYTGQSKFIIVDIKNKKKPVVSGSCEVFANSWSVLVEGDYAYLSSSVYDDAIDDYRESRVQIIDIMEAENPLPAGEVSIPGGAWELDFKDNFLFVSNNEGGVSAINISDPKNPAVAAFLSTGGNSYDIDISGDYGYIADGFEGLVIISLQKRASQDGMIIQDGQDETEGNKKPIAGIEVSGDKLDGGSYPEDNTIFFSAVSSYDPEGENLNYRWFINGREIFDDSGKSLSLDTDPGAVISEKGDMLAYVFDDPGKYEVMLEVSDGTYTVSKISEVNIAKLSNPVDFLKDHNFTVEIECILENTSNIELKNLECYLRTPQSYSPFQSINRITANLNPVDEVFDGSANLLTHFKFDKDVTVKPSETFSAKITADVTMHEYSFPSIEPDMQSYNPDDEDLQKYTAEDLFIDTDSRLLIDAVNDTIGTEKNPETIARMLYKFVADNLYYDFPRAADRNYEFMSASEILLEGKGVCADYAILYTTLLRIAGIPARVIGGIPVMLILSEPNKEIDIGHAWVELKLPDYGWIPVDITQEEGFMKTDYFLNLATEKGTSFLYESQTMDWSSYYYDGFKYEWDGQQSPGDDVVQKLIFRIKNLETGDLYVFQ